MNSTNATYGDSTNDNTGGWGASGMRGALNADTTLARLTNNAYIKTVDKKYLATNNSSEQSTSQDKLWLLACSEVFPYRGTNAPKYGFAQDAESEVDASYNGQYKWYKDNVTADTGNTNAVKHQSTYGENTNYGNVSLGSGWWLRSPTYSNPRGFCSILISGGVYGNDVAGNGDVSPGFCI